MGAVNEETARRKIMQGNKGSNTKPEVAVRKLLHQLGARFRIHRKDLPGKPDITLPGRNLCIFVHGCFWHQHEGCYLASSPRKNTAFWQAKFEANKARDERNIRQLRDMGWTTAVIWECELDNPNELRSRLQSLFEGNPLRSRVNGESGKQS